MKSRLRNRYFTTTLRSNATTTFNPMEVRSSSSEEKSDQSHDWPAGPIVYLSNNDWNDSNLERYRNLYEAIYTMGELPEDHDFHVDRNAVRKAANLLAVMKENFDIEAPKVLPQDGDAVVFTWDHGSFKRYLTVDADEFDIMDLNRAKQIRCVHDTSGDDQWALVKLIGAMGAKPVSSSSVE